MIRVFNDRSKYPDNFYKLVTIPMVLKENIDKFISLCICVRVQLNNKWVLDRLSFILDHYNPKPTINILDLGSDFSYAYKIKHICKKYKANYYYENYKGVFNLAKGRNLCYKYTTTPFIFFADIDFVCYTDFFYDLYKYIFWLDFNEIVSSFLVIPIYHLSQHATKKYLSMHDKSMQDGFLCQISFHKIKESFGKTFEFITFYSNAIFISKKCFSIVGGYNESFCGYGSEDFEFLIRLGLTCTSNILPSRINENYKAPLSKKYFGDYKYKGFRSYFESISIPSNNLGLKIFHLYHVKPKDNTYWTTYIDKKRKNFNTIISTYINNYYNILKIDYINTKPILCISSKYNNWLLVLFFRSLGDYCIENVVLEKFYKNNIFLNLNKNWKQIFIFDDVISLLKKRLKYLNKDFFLIQRTIIKSALFFYNENNNIFKNVRSILPNSDLKFRQEVITNIFIPNINFNNRRNKIIYIECKANEIKKVIDKYSKFKNIKLIFRLKYIDKNFKIYYKSNNILILRTKNTPISVLLNATVVLWSFDINTIILCSIFYKRNYNLNSLESSIGNNITFKELYTKYLSKINTVKYQTVNTNKSKEFCYFEYINLFMNNNLCNVKLYNEISRTTHEKTSFLSKMCSM